MYIYSENKKYDNDAKNLALHLNAELLERPEGEAETEPMSEELRLCFRRGGLSLECGRLALCEDYESMLPRVKNEMWKHELLAKSASFKGEMKEPGRLNAIDATAGLGEDSLILAAAGFNVTMYEYNPVIAALLKDAVRRAKKHPLLKDIVCRMRVVEGNSIEQLPKLLDPVDVIYLDPMFPEREKSALIKKKFQLLHLLESPCMEEEALLNAALQADSRRIVIKRPPKGPFVAGVKPDYSVQGKAVRFDCITGGGSRV